MKRAGVLLAALALASCAFDSEAPLFTPPDAAFPIEDGAYYNWRPYPRDKTSIVRFVRIGARYEARAVGEPEQTPMRLLFIAAPEIHDGAYIAQVDLNEEAGGVVYAFLWPLGEGRYRVVYAPRAFHDDGERAAPELCLPAAYGGCSFDSAQDVRSYFLRVLYPALSSGRPPQRYLDIEPIQTPSVEAPPRKSTRQ